MKTFFWQMQECQHLCYICCVEFPFHVLFSSSSSCPFLSLPMFPCCLTLPPDLCPAAAPPLCSPLPLPGPVLKKDMTRAYNTVNGVKSICSMEARPPAGSTLPPLPPPRGSTNTVAEGAISSCLRLVVRLSPSNRRLGNVVERLNPP